MKAIVLALGLLATLDSFADEVVLKDGRRIEWRSLEDAGDTYVIVTPENTRVVVKRSEVEAIAKTEHASPLTGAQVSFDKKTKLDVVDLLKRVDSEKDYASGVWKGAADGSLSCVKPDKVGASTFQVRYAPTSEEYNLTATIERGDEGDNVCFGLLTPSGAPFTYIFDLDMGKESCVFTAERKRISLVPGRQLLPKKARTVTFMVRKTGLVVQLDGKDFSVVRMDWASVTPFPGICPPEKGFAIEALTTGIRVTKMTLSYPAAQK